ncbi:MAG: hypothetical protein AB1778_04035 [Candidatus Bipolaricaulota bacterium]
MTLSARIDASGELSIARGGVAIRDLAVSFGQSADQETTLRASPWEHAIGRGAGGLRSVVQRTWTAGTQPVARQEVETCGDVVWIRVVLEEPVSDLATHDSFETSLVSAPRFQFAAGTAFLAFTYGLGSSGDGSLGGYWPAGICGRGPGSLPREAFAPLVLYGEGGALAVSPSSQFLTSPLVRAPGGAARALHGAIGSLPAGTILETVCAGGDDVAAALLQLGDALLQQGGKRRPDAAASVATSALGWWNAYGGYYTEPIRPLGADHLAEVLAGLRGMGIPIGYVGLDLWYPYREIGQAVQFAPDPAKYAGGLADLGRRFDVSFVLHLSALAADNGYRAKGGDADFYTDVAAEISRQGGCAAWHDWLRTQQHLSSALRSDSVHADRWFSDMAGALHRQGLSLVLCMQTMGMALASTQMPNALAARTAIDYLFGQPEALETLANLGHPGFRRDAMERRHLRRQNALVGAALYALGLLPFHDLFLSRAHPGLGGAEPRIEAALRALSCGPVGIGDGPGMTDPALVSSLISSRGVLLHPDAPPMPDTPTLGGPVEVYRTERLAGEARWEYVWAMNASDRTADLELPRPDAETLAWDVLAGRTVESTFRRLAPGQVAYMMYAPSAHGIVPLGFLDKLVPAPVGSLQHASTNGAWHIHVEASRDWFSFFSPDPLHVADASGHPLRTVERGEIVCVEVPTGASTLVVTRR